MEIKPPIIENPTKECEDVINSNKISFKIGDKVCTYDSNPSYSFKNSTFTLEIVTPTDSLSCHSNISYDLLEELNKTKELIITLKLK